MTDFIKLGVKLDTGNLEKNNGLIPSKYKDLVAKLFCEDLEE